MSEKTKIPKPFFWYLHHYLIKPILLFFNIFILFSVLPFYWFAHLLFRFNERVENLLIFLSSVSNKKTIDLWKKKQRTDLLKYIKRRSECNSYCEQIAKKQVEESEKREKLEKYVYEINGLLPDSFFEETRKLEDFPMKKEEEQ